MDAPNSSKRKRILLLTGDSGIGKTTILLKVVEALKAEGYSVAGMVSREVRSHGSRVGFEILDLTKGVHGWLAHINQSSGPQLGRYRVNLHDLNAIGADSIIKAVENADVVAIDEIGPMELFSAEFKSAVESAVKSKKLLVSVIHRKARNSLIDEVKMHEDAKVFVATYENRENLDKTITAKAIEFLVGSDENKAL